jgi:hypothetical protein
VKWCRTLRTGCRRMVNRTQNRVTKHKTTTSQYMSHVTKEWLERWGNLEKDRTETEHSPPESARQHSTIELTDIITYCNSCTWLGQGLLASAVLLSVCFIDIKICFRHCLLESSRMSWSCFRAPPKS